MSNQKHLFFTSTLLDLKKFRLRIWFIIADDLFTASLAGGEEQHVVSITVEKQSILHTTYRRLHIYVLSVKLGIAIETQGEHNENPDPVH